MHWMQLTSIHYIWAMNPFFECVTGLEIGLSNNPNNLLFSIKHALYILKCNGHFRRKSSKFFNFYFRKPKVRNLRRFITSLMKNSYFLINCDKIYQFDFCTKTTSSGFPLENWSWTPSNQIFLSFIERLEFPCIFSRSYPFFCLFLGQRTLLTFPFNNFCHWEEEEFCVLPLLCQLFAIQRSNPIIRILQ